MPLSRFLPELRPETAEERLNRLLVTPTPELPEPPTLNDLVNRGLDDLADGISDRLGIRNRTVRRLVRRAVRTGVDKGIGEALDAAMDAAGLDDTAQRAIRESVRAARELPLR